MRVRFQVVTSECVVLNTELQARNRFVALHELLKKNNVPYNPTQFCEKEGWLQFNSNGTLYRTSSRFG